MKSYIKYLGVIDHSNKRHVVEFHQGVNVITGKSSTGKSALIEIFDYCFGSSEFTIPSGIITEKAEIYFMALVIGDTNIVIGRKYGSSKIFLKEETILPEIKTFNRYYFEDKFLSSNFNVELGHYFGLNINDIDEDEDIRELRHKKKGRPSIRNMIPYLLQHQNLIANKHSLFYRFDEKEKREQTIDQFKIFAGFVTQEYYVLKQKLSDEERTLKTLESRKNGIEKQSYQNSKKLSLLMEEYNAVAGKKLLKDGIKTLLINPGNTLERIKNIIESVDYESDESINYLNELRKQRNLKEADKRDLQNKLNDIARSIEHAKNFNSDIEKLTDENEESIKVSECPFCHKYNETILEEANNLVSSINWLNKELSKSNYLLDSFASDRNEVEIKIRELEKEINSIVQQINKIENISQELRKNKTLEEQAFKIKLKIENFLEDIIDNNTSSIDEEIEKSKSNINSYNERLQQEFNVSTKLKNAEDYINKQMKVIGEKFDFEESYKPINLKFSLDTFELWHERENEKIYLRSMGSGANWLYSHIVLFLSIQKYFCSLSDQSLLPPILFLDQPSQVYFPTTIEDKDDEFNIDEIERRKGTDDKKDEDLLAVTNLFNQLVDFCKMTSKETGVDPQIIVTDHADNICLSGEVNFETLVKGRRWRKRGFIDESNTTM